MKKSWKKEKYPQRGDLKVGQKGKSCFPQARKKKGSNTQPAQKNSQIQRQESEFRESRRKTDIRVASVVKDGRKNKQQRCKARLQEATEIDRRVQRKRGKGMKKGERERRDEAATTKFQQRSGSSPKKKER